MFDVLEQDAMTLPRRQRDDVIDTLVSLAREVTEDQEALIGATSHLLSVTEGNTSIVVFKKEEDEHSEGPAHGREHADSGHIVDIAVCKVGERAVALEVTITPFSIEYLERNHDDPSQFPCKPVDSKGALNPESIKREFKVSYFDAPLTDNTRGCQGTS